MTWYCIECWSEIDKDASSCPKCGARQDILKQESLVNKLVRALRHPEPETPVRAAFILGKLKAISAVPALARLSRSASDPYIAAACVRALGEIGGREAYEAVRKLLEGEVSVIVRDAAREVLLMITAQKRS
jgi:HEAT repeat protein